MSANVLKEELSDLKQVIMIYSDQQAKTQITHRGDERSRATNRGQRPRISGMNINEMTENENAQ